MDRERIRQEIYARIDEIPTIPVVITRLLELLENDQASVAQLTQVISGDPALTAKVLRVANSAYYGFSQTISSLDRAVALLGLNMVKSLALSIGVMQNLPKAKDVEQLSGQRLWLHSLAVATLAKEISADQGRPPQEDHLFVVGLLHDVGKIVLLHYFAQRYQEVLEKCQDLEALVLYQLEREIMGFDHGQVGAMLLTRWKFPPQVILPIQLHHNKQAPPKADAVDLAVIKVADAVTHAVDLGGHSAAAPGQADPAALEVLKMTDRNLDDLGRFLGASQEKLQNFFSAMTS